MKFLFSIFFTLTFWLSHAGNNDKAAPALKNVSGRVTAPNGELLAGARIIVKETGESFFADLDGKFKFSLKTDKPYSVLIESIGYQALEIKSTQLTHFSDLSLQELN